MLSKRNAGGALALRSPPEGLDPLTVLETTTDCVYIVDPTWHFTYTNQHFVEQIAQGRDLVGQTVWECFPEVAKTQFASIVRKTMAQGGQAEHEEYYEPLDAWFSVNLYRLPQGIAVFLRDTTERKRAAQALAESERRFRVMFETLIQGVIFQDGDGRVIDCNPAAERILGRTRESMLGVLSVDPRWRATDEYENPLPNTELPSIIALRTGALVRGRVIGAYNAKLDERRWLQVDAIPQFRPGETEPYQVYAMFTDITEQREAERALRESQAHLALAQRVASVGSAEINLKTGTWKWTDQTYRIYGVDPAPFNPDYDAIMTLVHPDDRDRVAAIAQAASEGIAPKPFEFRVLQKEGAERLVRLDAELFRDATGELTRVLTTVRDITELRDSERRGDELRNQLLHAQRMDALGTLAGGIAHDINNTLVPVLGLTNVLRKKSKGDPETLALLDVVLNSGRKARDLVRQIVAFSRQENPKRNALDLYVFLKDMMPLLRASVPTTIKLVEKIEPVPPIQGDASQLHQVILNLVVNATQAIDVEFGDITIELALAPEALSRRRTDARMIRLSVIDTGMGMDAPTMRRIFEPFFTTKPVGQGTGLGLSVAHGIVAAHGGRIEVSSVVNQGSRFDILLPVTDV